jgi:cell division septum initiation protein DivIVA
MTSSALTPSSGSPGFPDQPESLTGEDLRRGRGYELRRARIGRRGYDEGDVNVILHRLAGQVDRMLTTITDQQGRLAELHYRNDRLWAASSGDAGGEDPTQRIPEEALRVLDAAQHTADRQVNDARAQAGLIVDDAHLTAQQIITDAQAQADQIVSDALGRAGTLSATLSATPRQGAWLNVVLTALVGARQRMETTRELMDSVIAAFQTDLEGVVDPPETATAALVAGMSVTPGNRPGEGPNGYRH